MRREASASGMQSTGQGRGLPDGPDEANGALGGSSSYHRFRTTAHLEMGKAATRSVSRPGRVKVRHLWMPAGHRRRPPHGLRSLEVRPFGEEVAQLMCQDREPIPDTCFLTPFEVDKGPDPALLLLPQV